MYLQATIIGYKSKLILFIGIRNRYCCVCQRAKNKHVPIPEHACFLNWKKGATSMEADAIAEGFKLSVSLHGLKYNKLIGKYKCLIINITFLKGVHRGWYF